MAKHLDDLALPWLLKLANTHQGVILDVLSLALSFELSHELPDLKYLSFVHDDIFGGSLKNFFISSFLFFLVVISYL